MLYNFMSSLSWALLFVYQKRTFVLSNDRALSRSDKKSLIQNIESETVNRRKTGNTMS